VVTTTYDAMREAIELLTQCFVLVQGQTVSIMGSVKGIKQAGLKYQRHADMLGIFRDIVDSLEIKIVLKWL
jgi:glycerol-3-phosphate responsive antiterminator